MKQVIGFPLRVNYNAAKEENIDRSPDPLSAANMLRHSQGDPLAKAVRDPWRITIAAFTLRYSVRWGGVARTAVSGLQEGPSQNRARKLYNVATTNLTKAT